jgi:hypothetical protein
VFLPLVQHRKRRGAGVAEEGVVEQVDQKHPARTYEECVCV